MTSTTNSHSEKIYWLDAFCGAGGASTGIERVPGNFVAVGINHDIRAIEAHRANHPNTVHLNDDIRKVKIEEVAAILHSMGIQRINLWWSAECTHLSNAKGGASRDADSRMLSEDMFRYIDGLNRLGIAVDMVLVENVKEFFSWTALRPKLAAGKRGIKTLEKSYIKAQIDLMEAVVSNHEDQAEAIRDLIDQLSTDLLASNQYATEKGELLLIPDGAEKKEKGSKATGKGSKGAMYLKWVRHMEDRGYTYDYRMLNAADFGAYQSRDRYFGVFVKSSLGVRPQFPQATHAKNPGKGNMFEVPLPKWKACREILDLQDKGESILYGRKGRKPLVAATLERIKFGINKFQGEEVMVDRGNTGSVPAPGSGPAPTVKATFKHGLIQVAHVDNHSFHAPPVSIDDPLPTAMANRDKYLMQGFVVPSAFGNGPYQPDRPLLTLTANRKHQYLCVPFIANQYSSGGHNQCSSVDAPTWAVTTSNHQGLCNPLLVNNYGKSPIPGTPDNPLGAVTTKPKTALCLPFIVPQFGQSKATSTAAPVGTLTTNPKFSLNQVMLCKYYGTGDNAFPVSEPMGTVTTKDRFCLVRARYAPSGESNFLIQYHGGKGAERRVLDSENPISTVGTENWPGVIQASFVQYTYGGHNSAAHSTPINAPLNTVGTGFTPQVVQAQFIQTSNGGGDLTRRVKEVSEALPTVMASPNASVCQAVLNATSKEWPIHIGLNPKGNKWHPAWMRIEGDYLVDNRIIDIHYRMLKVSELKLAQGFPASYLLDPKSETIAKKHIGNAVHVDAAKALVEANCGPQSPYSRVLKKNYENGERTFAQGKEAA